MAPPRKTVNRAMAHVQVGNDAAKAFYEGLGFKEDKVSVAHVWIGGWPSLIFRVENYYSKMEPRGAILMVLEDITANIVEKTNGAA